ncbi:tetrathionate reductase family octaheme c-type cytochrome [Chloroflexota bacterium]
MKKFKTSWTFGSLGILAILLVPVVYFWPRQLQKSQDPWDFVPPHSTHTNHANIVQGPFETGSDVTLACLECHADAADQVMHTTHFTWESEPFIVEVRDEPVTIGKANQLNNFCISAWGNQKRCMTCHAGYNWQESGNYDFTDPANVDCLVCHASTNLYAKGEYGAPAEGVDLQASAQSVAAPNRENCGTCHFNGGGGDNVKHGDLDTGLAFPNANLDVHMGANDFLCTDCHTTDDHIIKGRLVADNYSIDPAEQVACVDCHAVTPHDDDRINVHTQTVACQTCHVPFVALNEPTKVFWDWSTSGQDRPEDHYTYLKIKGDFIYEKNVLPNYLWYNGNLSYRYLLGDEIDPDGITVLDQPAGDVTDPAAKIFPFKLHDSIQPYDAVYKYLLAPITAGDNGYWSLFDWDLAFELAESVTGLEYSGRYGFAQTHMYWPSTHMVQPASNALQCNDCHGDRGRLDWIALGYPGDPLVWGGRFQQK